MLDYAAQAGEIHGLGRARRKDLTPYVRRSALSGAGLETPASAASTLCLRVSKMVEAPPAAKRIAKAYQLNPLSEERLYAAKR